MIEVGSDGTGELVLNDDTKLALGPGSRLLLDKFVYDSDRKGSILINLAKGTLRFVTGLAEKPAYVVRVPSASITVRGTIFDVFTEANGTSWLLLQEGGVRVCTDGGTCREHNEPGKLVRITAADVGAPAKWSELSGVEKISFDSAFPFVVEPPSIDRKPKFKRDDIIKGLAVTRWLPDPPTVQNYSSVLGKSEEFPVWRWTFNSLFISLAVTLLVLTVSSLAAFAYSRLRWPGRDRLFGLIVATMLVPGQALLIPSYRPQGRRSLP